MKWTAGTHVPFPFLLVHSMFLTITRCGSRNTPLGSNPKGNEANTDCRKKKEEKNTLDSF